MPTISLVLYPFLPVPPLYHKHCPCPTDTSPISQALAPVLQIPPLHHMLWALSYRYLPFITSSGLCPTDTSPLSQVLVPVLQKPPLHHKLWPLSYRYLPFISSTGHYPTVTALIAQLLVLALSVHPLYHKFCPCLTVTSPIIITSTACSLASLKPLLHRQCVDNKVGASDPVRKAPISLECDNWRLGRDYFATKINNYTTFTLQRHWMGIYATNWRISV